MYSLNLALVWCEHARPANMDDADMAQNRVFDTAMEKQVDIRVRNVGNAPSEEKRTFEAALVYRFPMSCVQALPKHVVPRHNFGLSCFFSSPGSNIYVILIFIYRNEESRSKGVAIQELVVVESVKLIQHSPRHGPHRVPSQYFSARGAHRVWHDVAKTIFAARYVVKPYIYSPPFA